MIFRSLFAGILLALGLYPSPTLADVAGRYETVDDDAVIEMNMTIEADLNGNVRFQMAGLGGYYLLRGSDLFVVTKENGEFVVIRTEDLLIVQQEALERMGWKNPFSDQGFETPSSTFAPMKAEVVNGRNGIGYGIVGEGQDGPVYASLVVSSDPELAPLGRAIMSANQAAMKGMGSVSSMLGMLNDEMAALLEGGAMLRMLSIELTDVSFERIPESRFELPSTPLTIDQLRATTDSSVEPPPTLPPRSE